MTGLASAEGSDGCILFTDVEVDVKSRAMKREQHRRTEVLRVVTTNVIYQGTDREIFVAF